MMNWKAATLAAALWSTIGIEAACTKQEKDAPTSRRSESDNGPDGRALSVAATPLIVPAATLLNSNADVESLLCEDSDRLNEIPILLPDPYQASKQVAYTLDLLEPVDDLIVVISGVVYEEKHAGDSGYASILGTRGIWKHANVHTADLPAAYSVAPALRCMSNDESPQQWTMTPAAGTHIIGASLKQDRIVARVQKKAIRQLTIQLPPELSTFCGFLRVSLFDGTRFAERMDDPAGEVRSGADMRMEFNRVDASTQPATTKPAQSNRNFFWGDSVQFRNQALTAPGVFLLAIGHSAMSIAADHPGMQLVRPSRWIGDVKAGERILPK